MTHAGNYTCVAEIPGASSSKTLYLNVIPDNNGPIIWAENPKNVRAQIGDDVTIECQPSSKISSFILSRIGLIQCHVMYLNIL